MDGRPDSTRRRRHLQGDGEEGEEAYAQPEDEEAPAVRAGWIRRDPGQGCLSPLISCREAAALVGRAHE